MRRSKKNTTDNKSTHTLNILVIFSILVSVILLTACQSEINNSEDSIQEDVGFVMGTTINQTIYTEDSNITSDIIDLLTDTENKWISRTSQESEVAKINDNTADGKSTEISDKTAAYFKSALTIASDSDGAFDPTLGKLTDLWGFDNKKNEIPNESDIRNLVKHTDYSNVKLNGNNISMNEYMSIDFGAIGKGIGCDEIQNYLDERSDVRGALINIGGSSILSYGRKDNGYPWKIAILDPRDESNFLGTLSLEGNNHISTSGDYERYFEKNGKRYHHILNPSNGYPTDNGIMSVTVLTDNGAYSDALSTACFVLGYDKALDLLEKYDADAIFVDTDKNVYVTEYLKDKFKLTGEGYDIVSR